jgi:geranylgeranyl diphosphate synthase type I
MDTRTLRQTINNRLEAFFERKIQEAATISPALRPFVEEARRFVMPDGKRLRPMLFYHGYRAAGGQDESAALDAALSIELVHNYLLIHDDVIDEDDLRRGQATVHRHWEAEYQKKRPAQAKHLGQSFAIVIGDLLAAYGYEALARSRFADEQKIRALNKLNAILSDVMIGQTLDMLWSLKENVSRKDILAAFEYKTARYTLEGPLHLGALLAGASENLLKHLSRIALPLGTAFQVHDDILDLFGADRAKGRPMGSDLKAGKQTLLAWYARKHASAIQKRALKEVFGNHLSGKEAIETAKEVIVKTGALAYAQKVIRQLIGRSRAALGRARLREETLLFLEEIAAQITARPATLDLEPTS